ncbi:gamma carbonic anhydrase family protein [Catenovulum sediminis]|uniref:Gamma carbonic anhydrase family protein n=1 Tax=Catenovulum sediminis TaxID=1740262 RepID=A0ABV1RE61_9ALTE|nr:gamma carbonic anhydrase family protein [Catenovulum sediminis]
MSNLRPFNKVHPAIADNAYIDDSCVLVGDIVIDQDSSVWPLVAARGDVNYIKIGKRTNIQDGSILHVTRRTSNNPEGFPLIIGDDVTVGHKAMLHGCYIGDRVLIGMGAIVLDGAIINDDVMLAAGSLVAPGKKLESGYLYVGSPAKQARALNEGEIAFLKQSAQNYVELKDQYLTMQLPTEL